MRHKKVLKDTVQREADPTRPLLGGPKRLLLS